MKPRRTIVIWAFVLALAAYVHRRQGLSNHSAGGLTPGPAFVGLPAERVTAIDWVRGAAALRVERRGDGAWWMTSPLSGPAAAEAVHALALEVERLRPRSWLSGPEVAAPGALRAYGLDAAAGLLKIEAGEERLLLRIGNATPLSGQFYFSQVGVDGVFVADDGLLGSLPAALDDWRDRRLWDPGKGRVTSVKIPGATPLEAVRDAGGGSAWRLVQPVAARADAGQILGLVSALTRARIDRFVADAPPADPDALGLKPPLAEVVLGFGSNPPVRLQFGRGPTNAPGLVYLWRPDSTNLALVPAALTAILRAPLAAYRDRQLLPSLDGLSRIEWMSGGRSSQLALVGTNWWITQPNRRRADPEQAQYLLQQLGVLRIEDFASDIVPDYGKYGLSKPRATILFVWSGGRDPVSLDLGQRDGSEPTGPVYARRSDEPAVYTVRAADLLALPETAEQLADLHFEESQVVRVRVRRGGRRRILEPATDGAWRVTGGEGGPPPFGPAIAETLHRMGALRTSRFMARPESLYTGLRSFAEIDYDATVELADSASVKSLRFRLVVDNGAAAIALLNVDDNADAWRVELPGELWQSMRRDFGAP